jgi:hypothetical protein
LPHFGAMSWNSVMDTAMTRLIPACQTTKQLTCSKTRIPED